MAKKVTGMVKLQLPAGKASPAPPVGPALGPHGINIMAFCKEFNAKTQGSDMIIPVVLTVYSDRSLQHAPEDAARERPPQEGRRPVDRARSRAAGSKEPNKNKVGKVTMSAGARARRSRRCRDMNCTDVESADAHRDGHRPLDGHRHRRLRRSCTRPCAETVRFAAINLAPPLREDPCEAQVGGRKAEKEENAEDPEEARRGRR